LSFQTTSIEDKYYYNFLHIKKKH